MKKVWVKAVPWNKKIITTAIEGGADAVLVPEGYSSRVKELGLIGTVAPDGDLKLGQDVLEREITCKADEEDVVRLSKVCKVVVRTTDWTIIPLENIIAQADNLIAEVRTAEEARTAVNILEKGVETVLIATEDLAELKRALSVVKCSGETVELTTATIAGVRPLGMGDRVCVDTCTNMNLGEGMLVGNSSAALFLIHAESIENPYVATRPFRVNAGPVHAYTRVPGGRTRYLSELAAGDEVLVVNSEGLAQVAAVGRVKVEKRPLMLISATAPDGSAITTIVQNAETIRLTSPEGGPLSVVKLRQGDKVLTALEKAGRHFGIKVDETISEK
ncbi:MAG: 3-dehydroquinate synthase II [Pseudomonadota bacterium]